MSVSRIMTVSTINGQGNREKAVIDAMDQLNIAVRNGMTQMTMEAISEAQNVQPNVLVVMGDAEQSRIELGLSTWEDIEEFKKIPGVWFEHVKQWTSDQHKPVKDQDRDTWKKVRITVEPI